MMSLGNNHMMSRRRGEVHGMIRLRQTPVCVLIGYCPVMMPLTTTRILERERGRHGNHR